MLALRADECQSGAVPTYSYACTSCDHRFDVQQSFSDAALTDCPECAGRLRKVFSPVGVVFKGSGFYRTDSRSGAATPSAKPAGESPAGAGDAAAAGAGAAAPDASGGSSGSAGGNGGGPAGGSTAGTSGSGSATPAPAPAA